MPEEQKIVGFLVLILLMLIAVGILFVMVSGFKMPSDTAEAAVEINENGDGGYTVKPLSAPSKDLDIVFDGKTVGEIEKDSLEEVVIKEETVSGGGVLAIKSGDTVVQELQVDN